MKTLLLIVYFVIGAVVAQTNGYLADLNNISGILSAALAIVLWPLVLLGVNLDIGGRDRGGRGGGRAALIALAFVASRERVLASTRRAS